MTKTKDKTEAPDQIVLRYTGKGMGAWMVNVPARDLARAEIDDLIACKITTMRDLLDSGCYEQYEHERAED